MRVKFIYFFVFLMFFPIVSSTIIFENNFGEIYNHGDFMNLNYSLERVQGVSGFLEINLVCGDDSFLVSKQFVNLESGVENKFFQSFPLGDFEGDCFIEISFEGEVSRSPFFELTDSIEIDCLINDLFFYPGDSILIEGIAKKKNGQKLEGFVNLFFNEKQLGPFQVSGGVFNFTFNLEDNFPSGNYSLKIEAYDLDQSESVLNFGSKVKKIYVEKVVKSIKIYSETDFLPPGTLNFKVISLDQEGNSLDNETIFVKVFDTSNEIIFTKEVISGENISLELQSDAIKGGWKINAYYGSVFSSFPVYILANPQLEVGVDSSNHFLILKNVGNVPYEGVYSYSFINSSNETSFYFFNVSLGVGEVQNESFLFEDSGSLVLGEKVYPNIHVSPPPKSFGITGRAISVGEEIGTQNYYFFFGFLVLLLIIYFFKFFRKRFFSMKKFIFSFRKKNLSNEKKVVLDKKSKKVKYSLLFIESRDGLSKYEQLVFNSGFSLKKINSSLGYVLASKGDYEKKLYDLSLKIKEVSISREDFLTLSLSVGYFEPSKEFLKRFAMFSRNLLHYNPGKIVITERFFSGLDLNISLRKKQIKVFGRPLQIYLLD